MIQYHYYEMPQTREELFRLLESIDRDYVILSGATDLYAHDKTAFETLDCAVDISGIDEFRQISAADGEITIGAMTRIQRFLEDPELIKTVPLFRHAACFFADRQIRQMATIGGNVANASPVGDMIPCLLALDARGNTMRPAEGRLTERSVPIGEFIVGVGKTQLEKGEVITSFSCPILENYGCAFKKVGLRRSLCISTVNAAFMVKTDESGQRFDDVRIAFGAIGPVDIRLTAVEDFLRGKAVTPDTIEACVNYLPEGVIRSRSRREYRSHIGPNFLRAGLREALADLNLRL